MRQRCPQDNRVLKRGRPSRPLPVARWKIASCDHTRYTDWHRVERAMIMFAMEIGELEELGWTYAAGVSMNR
jgi:hypothetical protein